MARKRKQYGDGGIYPDKQTGGFIIKIPDGHGGYIRRRAKTYEAAEHIYQTLSTKKQEGIHLNGATQRLETFAATWFQDVAVPRGIADNTKHQYQQMIKLYIVPAHGAYRLEDIHAADVQTLLNKLQKDVSTQTIRHMYSVYKQIMDTAEKWRYITRNPVLLVSPPRITPYQPTLLTPADVYALLHAVAGHRLEPLYHTDLVLGLRKGELLGLRWSDLNHKDATLTITQQAQWVPAHDDAHGTMVLKQPKSETSKRTLPVPPHLLMLYDVHWECQQEERKRLGTAWKEHTLLFPSEKGTPMQPRNLSRHYKQTLAAAGLDTTIRFHDLRHTCATLLGEYTPEHVVSAILGHSSANVTRRYMKGMLQSMRQAVEHLECTYLERAA